MKRLLLLATCLGATAAFGWESYCYQHADPLAPVAELEAAEAGLCSPAAGPNTARQRWVGPLDEHRQLWEETRLRAGLPAALSQTVRLEVFASSATVPVGQDQVPSLQPAPFELAERTVPRAFSVGELAQLPDFSYALWDWAMGHETCPLTGVGAGSEACHDFATHMGPVNSNHFLPQAGAFYGRYHQLALARAAACGQMTLALGAEAARFDDYLKACEVEALALEAVGQHYLQDAWSTGHMWERWGAPDLQGFPGVDPQAQRDTAVLVALVSGLIHGSRGVLQKLPTWTSFDVNDALCAPDDAVRFVTDDGAVMGGVGDDYLALLQDHTDQSSRFFSCAASGMLEVYEATGRRHGPVEPPQAGWQRVDPTGPGCFGQRATNRAILKGMGVQLKVAGFQVDLPLDGRTVALLVPKVAQQNGEATVAPALSNRFRLQLMRMVSMSRLYAHDAPEGTELATGRLGSFLGAEPNGAHLDAQGASPLATYLDPAFPWPDTQDPTDPGAFRAKALARVFHRGHADDWCRVLTEADLDALATRAKDTTLLPEAQAAACAVCVELSARHLRVGDPGSWAVAREPVCHYLATTPAYVYQPGDSTMDRTALAQAWCGC